MRTAIELDNSSPLGHKAHTALWLAILLVMLVFGTHEPSIEPNIGSLTHRQRKVVRCQNQHDESDSQWLFQ